MHWNVAPDALPVSAMLVPILDHWCNDCVDTVIGWLDFEDILYP